MLVFAVVTAVLLGCWGVLTFAPGAAEPGSGQAGSAEPTDAESAGTYGRWITVENLVPNETPAEARARQRDEQIRRRQLGPISVAIGELVGPGWPEQKLLQIADQAIVLCHDEAEARGTLIANGVPSGKVKAVIETACYRL